MTVPLQFVPPPEPLDPPAPHPWPRWSRAMVLLIAAAMAIAAFLGGCSASAREPLPTLDREAAELERMLPVMLSARATQDAATVVLFHRGRLGR